jgi:host factor-I protein
MPRSQINLQDAFLNRVRKEKIPVVINMAGGGKIEGLVKGFDNFVILVKHEGQHLIYKHAINTIVPERPVDLTGHAHPHEESAAEVEEAPAPQTEEGEPWVEG